MIFNNHIGVKSMIGLLEKYDTVQYESEKSPIVPPIALGIINEHGKLHGDANQSDVLAFIWQDPKIRLTNRHLGNCAGRWFSSEAEDALLAPGNYADPLLLEEWLIDSISGHFEKPPLH
jgi:hypothetical protein